MARARFESPWRSKLPVYEIKPAGEELDGEWMNEFLLVWCPREDCPSHKSGPSVLPFMVHQRSWQRPLRATLRPDVTLKSRPCPYCFKVSKLRA